MKMKKYLINLILILIIIQLTTQLQQIIDQNYTQILLDQYPYAKCLDGTPAGFYWKPGLNAGKNKFLIYLEGGGWWYIYLY